MNQQSRRDLSIEKGDKKEEALTVSRVTDRIRQLLESRLGNLWVKGEISNYTKARSGHIYFTLKDEEAVLPVALFRRHAKNVEFDLEDGLEVCVFGKISAYARRGNYQIIARRVKPLGEGALQLAFEQLKEKLQEEGLFDEEHKQDLPYLPARIALITSPRGAAVRDMIRSIHARFPLVCLRVVPVRVQGEEAAPEIVAAINMVNRHRAADLIVTGRGGGSLEDLWAFNEESVARAVFESDLPVVSAVGHEVDVTICDLVADRRVPTPTGAGSAVVPEYDELVDQLRTRADRAQRYTRRDLRSVRNLLQKMAKSVKHAHPGRRIKRMKEDLHQRANQIDREMSRILEDRKKTLEAKAEHLESLSPLNVLQRGYSITRKGEEGPVVTDVDQVQEGDVLHTRLSEGTVTSEVRGVKDQT